MTKMGGLRKLIPHTFRHDVRRDARDRGRPARGLLLEGRDPRRDLGRGYKVLWVARGPHGRDHGVLHVPAHLDDVLRDVPRGDGAAQARPRVARHDDGALWILAGAVVVGWLGDPEVPSGENGSSRFLEPILRRGWHPELHEMSHARSRAHARSRSASPTARHRPRVALLQRAYPKAAMPSADRNVAGGFYRLVRDKYRRRALRGRVRERGSRRAAGSCGRSTPA
jgi:hypothetical protein